MKDLDNSIWFPIRYMSTLIWIGAIVAISFMEAPLKFQAPSVTLPIGLEIGRLVFGALNKLEWGLLLLVAGSFLLASARKKSLVFTVLLLLILICQTFFLLPELDHRAELIIRGVTPTGSNAHVFYVALEVVKLTLLLITSIHFIYQRHEIYQTNRMHSAPEFH